MPEKREQILRAATTLFGKHGYHAVGIDWIIAESKVSKMTMYRHFPSKGDLVVAVLKTCQYRDAESLERYATAVQEPVERLKRVFDWHREWFNSDGFTGSMFAHAAYEFSDKGTQIHRINVEQKSHLTCFIGDILSDIIEPQKAQDLAPVLVMLLDGATLGVQVFGAANARCDIWEAACGLAGINTVESLG